MKLKFAILLVLLTISMTLPGKSKLDLPDSYAFTRGIEAYQNEDFAEAKEWFERELSEHPDNGYAHVYLSSIQYMANDYGRALSALDKALKYIPKKDKDWRARVFASRAEIYSELGDTLRAFGDLEQAIKTNPSNPQFFTTRAELNYRQNNFAASDADYRKLIALDRGNVMGYMGLGRNAKTQQRWDDAIEQFNRTIMLAPDFSPGYSFRAEVYTAQEKWAEAVDDIVKALDIDVNDKAFFLMQDLPEEALGLLRSKLKIQMTKQPDNSIWLFCLATSAQCNEEYESAISYYEQANAIDPHPIHLDNISQCWLEQKNFTKALEYADRALDLEPEDNRAVNLKAIALGRLGRFEEALVERDRYVARNPDTSFAYYYRADERMSARRYDEAVEDYNTVVALDPTFGEYPYLLMKRGDAYRLTGRSESAVKDYEKLLTVEKDSVLSADSWTPFAWSGLGNAEKAIETMNCIMANDTTDREGTLYNAACVYARIGRDEEAINCLRQAIENGYDDFHHIEADYDLDGLRDTPEYRSLMERLISAQTDDSAPTQEETALFTTEKVEVPFTKEGGVAKVKCTINGLPLHFVFDTGATDVTISMVEANFMLKNDFIKPADILGTARYMDANGDISDGTVINLRNVDFGGLELENVRASVVRNQKAPLLLGQSVLGRLGRIEIDNPGMKLVITHRIPVK